MTTDSAMTIDLTGTWLGTYWQANIDPTRFEASLVQGLNTLSGNILDDGWLGEALVTGERSGMGLQFIKRYLSGNHDVVIYTGTIADDGDAMQGSWRIGQGDRWVGTWEAHRKADGLMEDLTRQIRNQNLVGVGR